MTLHITGTGWHGIKRQVVDLSRGGGVSHETVKQIDLPVEIAAALKPYPTCNGKSWVHEDRPGGYGIADPCPDCHEGHPTITVTVPCPTCEGRGVTRHHIRDMYASIRYADPCPTCSAGRVERQAVIREVLPVVIGRSDKPPYPDVPRVIEVVSDDSVWVGQPDPGKYRLIRIDERIDLSDAASYTHAAYFEVLP